MTTKPLLTLAIMLALPCAAMAENISDAMYTAPSAADTNHPAPTTQAGAPYGRIDIDTADQEHIATTAYVKGAYNSAIAATNRAYTVLNAIKQDALDLSFSGDYLTNHHIIQAADVINEIEDLDTRLISGGAVLETIDYKLEDVYSSIDTIYDDIDDVDTKIDSKRVEIYTTWNNDSAKTQVAFVSASGQQ